jgi:hypothetical protein
MTVRPTRRPFPGAGELEGPLRSDPVGRSGDPEGARHDVSERAVVHRRAGTVAGIRRDDSRLSAEPHSGRGLTLTSHGGATSVPLGVDTALGSGHSPRT